LQVCPYVGGPAKYDKLVDRVDILIEHPEAGRIVPEFEDESIRELIEGSYRIIYKIKSFDELGVLRVHHSARLLK
jgi:toxin ParE1/3/4